MCEVTWVLARVDLWRLRRKHLDWSKARLARDIGMSVSWVKKWLKRFAEVPEDKVTGEMFQSRSSAPKESRVKVVAEVEDRILAIRDNPPSAVRWVPGPKTILYYLHQQTDLQKEGLYLPTSTSTVWQILDKHGRIYRPPTRKREVEPRPEPMTHWQMDFKDVSTVPAEEGGKKQHVVETLNLVDKGTSILVASEVSGSFHAQTVIDALARVFEQKGLPKKLTFDRDPRFVASWTTGGYPSALVQFLRTLGIETDICPPHRPDRNGFVERFNRSYGHECVYHQRPSTLEEAIEATAHYQYLYNYERPNQALTCGGHPPRVAFSQLPLNPNLPKEVDPDRWLHHLRDKLFRRRVNRSGSIQVDKHTYYIKQELAKQLVMLRVDPQQKQFRIFHQEKQVKAINIKGLVGYRMDWSDYLPFIKDVAEAQWRYYQRTHALKRRKRF